MTATKHPDASRVVSRDPCPKCGSRDNLVRYADGHSFCFGQGCGYKEGRSTIDSQRSSEQAEAQYSIHERGLLRGEVPDLGLSARRIDGETCRRFDYLVGEDRKGNPVQIATYRDRDGQPCAQKLRYRDKSGFPWIGNAKLARLYGSHLFGRGKKLVITEGEIDCMSVSQQQKHKWPVVSIINGASNAKRDLLRNIDYLENFEEIILMFDNDEPHYKENGTVYYPGQDAAIECAEALIPMNVKIAKLPLKDANAMLVAGRGSEIIDAIWNAQAYRPDGILSARALKHVVLEEPKGATIRWPWEGLNRLTFGLRTGEIIGILAGTKIGKTTLLRELVYSLNRQGETVGCLFLEESTKRTLDGIIGIHMNRPLHLGRDGITDADIAAAHDDFFKEDSPDLHLLDHFGSSDEDALFSKIRYMVKALGCRWIVLDHISIVVSGLDVKDERRAIDMLMTKLRTFVQKEDVGLIIVSHLKRVSDEDSHEEGGEVKASHARGSQAIAQLSDILIGLERDKRSKTKRNWTYIKVLANRFSGEEGLASIVEYDKATGRLNERPVPQEKLPEFQDESESKPNDF